MKGQISFDYLAGAMVFFSALIFLTSSVLNVMPAFEQSTTVSDIELSSWAMTEILLQDEGYWEQGNFNGTDWENQPEFVQVIGLHGKDGELSAAKLNALTSMEYEDIRDVFGTDIAFDLSFTEYVTVDTYTSFSQGAAPSFITEPGYSAGEADVVHYGTEQFAGGPRYVLLTDELGWYNKLYLSDDWDFTDATVYNLTDTRFIPIGGGTYAARASHTRTSNGNLLIFSRGLGRVGATPAQDVGNIVSINRFGVLEGNVVKLVMRGWKP